MEAEDADRGLELALEVAPDLIVMDIQLPGTDGLTATRLIKNDSRTRAVPVLALTAHAMLGDEERILTAGCDAYLAKPLRYRQFLDLVERLLNGSGPP